jgi:hypothetical protein
MSNTGPIQSVAYRYSNDRREIEGCTDPVHER